MLPTWCWRMSKGRLPFASTLTGWCHLWLCLPHPEEMERELTPSSALQLQRWIRVTQTPMRSKIVLENHFLRIAWGTCWLPFRSHIQPPQTLQWDQTLKGWPWIQTPCRVSSWTPQRSSRCNNWTLLLSSPSRQGLCQSPGLDEMRRVRPFSLI